MTCVGTAVLHFGQDVSCAGFLESWDRRFPVLEFECLRLGTAMVQSECWVRVELSLAVRCAGQQAAPRFN